jgi:streptogramin lyase
MTIRRREFFGATLAVAAAGRAWGQGRGSAEVPARSVKVEKLYKAPDAHPNALEAADDGLWIADQISEHVAKVDWETGKVLHEFVSESHNTSGIAVGGGYLWLNANGAGSAAQMRPPRPTDKPFGEIIKADMKTGKAVKAYDPPWGGVHGATYVRDTDKLWVVALNIGALAELDPKDDLRVLRMIPVRQNAPHGIAWHEGSLWCLSAGDRLAQKLDPDSGRVLDVVALTPQDPDPHGMCIHNGYMYYCDAGLGGGRQASPGAAPAYVCRFKLS